MIPLTGTIQNRQNSQVQKVDQRLRDWREWGGKLLRTGCRVSISDDENIMQIDNGNGGTV